MTLLETATKLDVTPVSHSQFFARAFFLTFFANALLFGCGGAPTGPDAGATSDASSSADAARAVPDAAIDAMVDDGTPTRQACTGNFGHGLTRVHGRIDGTLVSIVPESSHGCNNDRDHLHLQILMQGEVYDVAVNIYDPADVDFVERDIPLPDGPWEEGWHPGYALDYVQLGLHADAFSPVAETALRDRLVRALSTVNHISVFMTAYGAGGGHDIHRRYGGDDGAIFTEPLSPTAHGLFFHFVDQTF